MMATVLVDEVGRLDVLEEGDGEVPMPADVLYCERFCACGGVLRIRGHREQLFGAGFVTSWERRHWRKGLPHEPAGLEAALRQRELVKAALGG